MIKKNPYVHTMYNSLGEYVILNSYDNRVLKASKEQSKLYETAFETQEAEEQIMKQLLDNNILYDDAETEIDSCDKLYEDFLNKYKDLHLVILPTDNCNFRCTYCYEIHEKRVILPEVQEGIINFVKDNIQNYNALRVEWFGGEPLCQKGIINDLTRQLRSICSEHKKPYYSSMTTNGYLLDYETFKIMHKKNHVMRYQITLDGTAESHNIQRGLVDGSPSFDTIVKNLKDIRDNCKSPIVSIAIRCNITGEVLKHFDEYVKFLIDEFGEDPRFELIWKIAWDVGSGVCKDFCEQKSLHTILGEQKEKGLRFGTNMRQFFRYGNICYASNRNSFVIGTDGTIYKCTIAFDAPVNHVGKLHQNGEMELDMDKYNYWTHRKANIDHELCDKCDIYPSCMGIYCNLNNVTPEGEFVCIGSKGYVDDFLEHISRVDNYVLKLEV